MADEQSLKQAVENFAASLVEHAKKTGRDVADAGGEGIEMVMLVVKARDAATPEQLVELRKFSQTPRMPAEVIEKVNQVMGWPQ